jgi:outer membrane protein assembly factor BamB
MNNPGPTVIDDTVYAVTQVELIAIDAIDGTVRWRYSEDPGSMKDAAIVHNGTYVASGESYGSLAIAALDRRNRSVQWRVSGRPQSSCSAGPERRYVPLYGIS